MTTYNLFDIFFLFRYRYIVILFPLKARSFLTKTRAIMIVIAAWLLSIVLGTPAIIYQVSKKKLKFTGAHKHHKLLYEVTVL